MGGAGTKREAGQCGLECPAGVGGAPDPKTKQGKEVESDGVQF